MKTDIEEFRKAFTVADARQKKLDELRLTVIKWHLLVEGVLDEFLTVALFHPEHIRVDEMRFHAKGNLALALGYKEDKDPFWQIFWAINQLRNKIAHNVDSSEVDQKMKYLRAKMWRSS